MGNPQSARSDTEQLLNLPVEVEVGGIGDYDKKKVEMREPSNLEFARQMKAVSAGIAQLIQDNLAFIVALRASEDMDLSKMMLDFDGFTDSINDLIAVLVDEDRDYVDNGMGPGQTIRVLVTYMELLGFDTIKSIFFHALGKWTAAGPVGTDPTTAPFVEQ